MANIKFYLKDGKDQNAETLILLRVFINYKSLKVSTGLKLKPKHWNKNKLRAVEWESFPSGKEINKKLDDLDNKAKLALESLENNFTPITPENFKKALADHGKVTRGVKKLNLLDFIQDKIDCCKDGSQLTPAGKKFSNFTIKGYNTTMEHLMKFQKKTGYQVNFETINMEFYSKFIDYFHKQGRATNTIGKHLKNIKVFAQEAVSKGVKVHPEALSKDFKVIHEQTDQVYLTENELKMIYDLDLASNPKLERVRDLFLIGCYTGLRFADLSTLNETSLINNGTLIKVRTQKTGETVTIPLHWMARAILQKYDNKPPRAISNQKTNVYIKDVCKEAGIVDRVTIHITKGGRSVAITKAKHELITCHTARRSFASNLFLAGVPTISIMKITGHRTEKSFMTYIRISNEDNANMLLNHPYFQTTNLKVVS